MDWVFRSRSTVEYRMSWGLLSDAKCTCDEFACGLEIVIGCGADYYVWNLGFSGGKCVREWIRFSEVIWGRVS